MDNTTDSKDLAQGGDVMTAAEGKPTAFVLDSRLAPCRAYADELPIDVETMRATVSQLLGDKVELPARDELKTATLQLRGHLMLLIPVVESSARGVAAGIRARALAGVREARRRLDLTPGPTVVSEVRHAQALARSVRGLLEHLQNLKAVMIEVWAPPQGHCVQLLPAGRWWDAVRVQSSIGARVLKRLGEDSGAVIEDGFGAILYWLVPPGAADEWDLPRPAVDICGTTSYVAVPPVTYTDGPGLHWVTPLTSTRYLTDARLLQATLEAEVDAALGPH